MSKKFIIIQKDNMIDKKNTLMKKFILLNLKKVEKNLRLLKQKDN